MSHLIKDGLVDVKKKKKCKIKKTWSQTPPKLKMDLSEEAFSRRMDTCSGEATLSENCFFFFLSIGVCFEMKRIGFPRSNCYPSRIDPISKSLVYREAIGKSKKLTTMVKIAENQPNTIPIKAWMG